MPESMQAAPVHTITRGGAEGTISYEALALAANETGQRLEETGIKGLRSTVTPIGNIWGPADD
jgi:hypothetical protein